MKILESAPLEEVLLTRDEMSNLVWGIERIIPLPHGDGKPDAEAAAEMLACQKRWFPASPPRDWKSDRRFELMTTVPENWIPFAPARLPGTQRAIRLQRAVMPRALDGDPAGVQPVRPRTSLMREGLDSNKPYFLFEEEVPRAGARVIKVFRRTRSCAGRAITWLAAQKRVGRGEGQSNLEFDGTPPAT